MRESGALPSARITSASPSRAVVMLFLHEAAVAVHSVSSGLPSAQRTSSVLVGVPFPPPVFSGSF